MAKEDIMYILLICLIYIFNCEADETEINSSEYYDYKTDQPSFTTTLRNHYLESQEIAKNTTNTPLENYNFKKGEHLFNHSSKKENSDLKILYDFSTDEKNSNEQIRLDFDHGNKPRIPSSLNPEYQVVSETIDQILPKEGNHTPLQVKIQENFNTTEHVIASKSIMKPKDILRHPCSRVCNKGAEPMTCYYKFDVEWYYAMSKACHNCSTKITDCFRPDCIAANGVKRPIIVVNRTLPGPSIEVCKGDEIIVDVHNNLMEESTSIHWHGHHQRGSPYMDGVPFITQCPIPPHHVFRYNYIAATPGTHFWHSHTGCQRTDGVVGNMIIRTPRSEDPHSRLYDEDLNEHVINIMDWAHELGVTMFLAHYHSDGDNKPESILINGKGRYLNLKNSPKTPLATFNVKQGVRYRFRLINAGNQNCPIELSIDNHTIVAINSDGGNFKPVEGGALVTYAGERWDFILKANSDVKNYWMRFKGLMDCDQRFTSAHQVAILHYEGASSDEPHEPVSYFGPKKFGLTINAMNVRIDDPDSVSIPELTGIDTGVINDPSLKKIPDHKFYIGYDFYAVDAHNYHKPTLYGFKDVKNKKEQVYTPQFNHISMRMPSIPLLSQRDSVTKDMFCDHKSLNNCTGGNQCECTNVIEIPLGDVVELILIDEGNTYNANHPFHLHGHAFRVIGMDRLGENTSVRIVKNLDNNGKLRRNLKNAPLKDSVTVPDGGYTIIRFHATNPGYWLFHCHLEFHVEVGMALIFKIGEHSQFPPVPEKFPRCGDYLYPKLLSEKIDKFNNKENEVNFGEDYGISYNVTHQRQQNEVVTEKTSRFRLSDLLHLQSRTSASSLSYCIHEYFLSIFSSFWFIVLILNQ